LAHDGNLAAPRYYRCSTASLHMADMLTCNLLDLVCSTLPKYGRVPLAANPNNGQTQTSAALLTVHWHSMPYCCTVQPVPVLQGLAMLVYSGNRPDL